MLREGGGGEMRKFTGDAMRQLSDMESLIAAALARVEAAKLNASFFRTSSAEDQVCVC